MFQESLSSSQRIMYFSACILLIFHINGCTQSSPSSSDIKGEFELNQVSGILELESFTLEGSKNVGSDEQPVWRARYTAVVSLKEETYEIDRVARDTQFLEPVRSAGEEFNLYGRVRSEPAGDGWRHSFQAASDSDPVIGRPISSYGPDALIVGTEEARALITEIEKQREQQRIAREARLAEQEAERRRAEEAEQARRERIEAAVARHNAAFAPEKIRDLSISNDPGTTRAFLVTADIPDGANDVLGTDVYRARSNFIKSVIHAGLLESGETGIVEVKIGESRCDFIGSPRNGINSKNDSTCRYSYRMKLLEKVDLASEDTSDST